MFNLRLPPLSRLIAAFSLCIVLSSSAAQAQLRVLSKGNSLSKWRETQLAVLQQQLSQANISPELKQELQSQAKWLEVWTPGSLTKDPLWPSQPVKLLVEPMLDPLDLAANLRERLLGNNAKPTSVDTRELQELLTKHPDDLGIRQLHLHWLDQSQYRATYPREIAQAASRVLALLNGEGQELKAEVRERAQAFTLYRRGRALYYRTIPEVVAKTPFKEGEKEETEGELLGVCRQLKEIVPHERPEFILLETIMLKRDHWHGRALALLENHGGQLNNSWFQKTRTEYLRDLGWDGPANEAQAIYEASRTETRTVKE